MLHIGYGTPCWYIKLPNAKTLKHSSRYHRTSGLSFSPLPCQRTLCFVSTYPACCSTREESVMLQQIKVGKRQSLSNSNALHTKIKFLFTAFVSFVPLNKTTVAVTWRSTTYTLILK